MLKNYETEAGKRFGLVSKTNFADKQNTAFSVSDYKGELESVQSIIERMMRPGKVVRLYQCFACKRNFPVERMSVCLAVCRECSTRTQGKGRIARLNEIDRVTNSIRIFLRARLEAK